MTTPTLFDAKTLNGLPPAAQKLIRHHLPDGTPLNTTARLKMKGTFKLNGRWLPCRAEEVIDPYKGFRWTARVGWFPFLYFGGGDYLDLETQGGKGQGLMDFRLWGVIPCVHAEGKDVFESGIGRLGLECCTWLPQTLTPQLGAVWREKEGGGVEVDVKLGKEGERKLAVGLGIGDDGRLEWLGGKRWGNPGGGDVCDFEEFGGRLEGEIEAGNGVKIGRKGRVGWFWGSDKWERDGEFFRYEIVEVKYE